MTRSSTTRIELNNVTYAYDGKTAISRATQWIPGSFLLPRNSLSIAGLIVAVQEVNFETHPNWNDRHNIGVMTCIPSSVEKISSSVSWITCFPSTTAFESGSQLLCLGDSAFRRVSSLPAIYIPSTVETIGRFFFAYCSSLSRLTFE
jgi:hypothetical protein